MTANPSITTTLKKVNDEHAETCVADTPRSTKEPESIWTCCNVNEWLSKSIPKAVVRAKLSKFRHLVVFKAISEEYLDSLFPQICANFEPQTVNYNGGIAQVSRWIISCYLEVLPGGVPTTNPHLVLLELCKPLLEACNMLFGQWYRQQHCCKVEVSCTRLMTFVTRYNASKQGQEALLKHVDGAGKVDGSLVLALPMESESPFEGGGLTVWDAGHELHYDTRSGDVVLLDRAVWHQADPITKGTRWALVIFYQVEKP